MKTALGYFRTFSGEGVRLAQIATEHIAQELERTQVIGLDLASERDLYDF